LGERAAIAAIGERRQRREGDRFSNPLHRAIRTQGHHPTGMRREQRNVDLVRLRIARRTKAASNRVTDGRYILSPGFRSRTTAPSSTPVPAGTAIEFSASGIVLEIALFAGHDGIARTIGNRSK